MDPFTFHPIGVISSPRKHRYDVPRQGVLDTGHEAEVLLHEGNNFEQALADLRGFDRIWLLSVFHLNDEWKPRVQVPRHSDRKIGVFATRAPYRPNPIGLTAARLLSVEGLRLRIAECDLIDGTPILDIKPYIPYADSFPDAATGWVPSRPETYTVRFDPEAMKRMLWLRSEDVDLLPFAESQLEAQPTDERRKRVSPHPALPDHWQLAYRTWRIVFRIDKEASAVIVASIRSGYSADELSEEADPYEDKALHRAFTNDYPE